jgi:hypothetical protein
MTTDERVAVYATIKDLIRLQTMGDLPPYLSDTLAGLEQVFPDLVREAVESLFCEAHNI